MVSVSLALAGRVWQSCRGVTKTKRRETHSTRIPSRNARLNPKHDPTHGVPPSRQTSAGRVSPTGGDEPAGKPRAHAGCPWTEGFHPPSRASRAGQTEILHSPAFRRTRHRNGSPFPSRHPARRVGDACGGRSPGFAGQCASSSLPRTWGGKAFRPSDTGSLGAGGSALAAHSCGGSHGLARGPGSGPCAYRVPFLVPKRGTTTEAIMSESLGAASRGRAGDGRRS